MSQSNNQTHEIDLHLGYNYFACASNKKCDQLKSPKSVKEELDYGPIHNSYSHSGAVYSMRPTPATSSICSQSSTTMSDQKPLIIGHPTNIRTVFRTKNMRSSSHRDTSNERIIVRSRLINTELSMKEEIHDPLIDGKEKSFVEDIESLSLENVHERNNRTCPLFESNRLLPSLVGHCKNDKGASKRCYRILFPLKSNVIPIIH